MLNCVLLLLRIDVVNGSAGGVWMPGLCSQDLPLGSASVHPLTFPTLTCQFCSIFKTQFILHFPQDAILQVPFIDFHHSPLHIIIMLPFRIEKLSFIFFEYEAQFCFMLENHSWLLNSHFMSKNLQESV